MFVADDKFGIDSRIVRSVSRRDHTWSGKTSFMLDLTIPGDGGFSAFDRVTLSNRCIEYDTAEARDEMYRRIIEAISPPKHEVSTQTAA